MDAFCASNADALLGVFFFLNLPVNGYTAVVLGQHLDLWVNAAASDTLDASRKHKRGNSNKFQCDELSIINLNKMHES